MNKVLDFFLNRKNLVRFYFYGLLTIDFIFHYFLPLGLYSFIRFTGFRVAMAGWTLGIIIYDIVKKQLCYKNVHLFLWIWAICGVIGLISSNSFDLYFLVDLGVFVMFTYVFTSIRKFHTKKDIKELLIEIMKVCSITILVVALISLIIFYFDISIPLPFDGAVLVPSEQTLGYRNNRIRYFGLFYDALSGALQCTLSISMGFYLVGNKRLPIWYQVINVIICGFMAYLTLSRTPAILLSIMGLYVIYAVLRNYYPRKKSALIVCGTAVVIAIVALIVRWGSIQELLQQMEVDQFAIINKFTSNRYRVWLAYLEEFKSHPIFGIGIANNAIAFKLNEPFANDIIISILVYSGIVGLICFTIFLVVLVKRSFRYRRILIDHTDAYLTVMIACFLIESLFENSIVGEYVHLETGLFWLISSYLLYCHYAGPRERIR